MPLFFSFVASRLTVNTPLTWQVGLVWKGGSGADEFVASQPIPSRRADSISPMAAVEPPSPPGRQRRRRSSLAQLTELIRDWGRGGGGTGTERRLPGTARRDTLADLARALPFGRRDSDWKEPSSATSQPAPRTGRRRSLALGQIKSKRRRDSGSDLRVDITKVRTARESVTELWIKRREPPANPERRSRSPVMVSSGRSSPTPREIKPAVSPDGVYIEPRALIEARQAALAAQREEAASPANAAPAGTRDSADTLSTAALPDGRRSPPTPHQTPMAHRVSLPTLAPLSVPADAASPDPREPSSPTVRSPSPRPARLRRQATTLEEGAPPPRGRSGSRPFLSPDPLELEGLRARRRDSLSPDSAAEELSFARRLRGRHGSGEDLNGRGGRSSHHSMHR